MENYSLVDGLLWILAAFGVVWAFGPPIFSILGLSRFHCTAQEDPDAVEPPGDDPDYRHKYQQLVQLGFRPVGVLTEYYWLFAFHWYKPFSFRCLVSADGTCIAALHRLAAEPIRVRLDSFTSGGYCVRTVPASIEDEMRDDAMARFEVPTLKVPELYERHQQTVARIAAGRGETVESITLGELANIDVEADKQRLATLQLASFLVLPAVFFLIPGLLVLLVTYFVWGAEALGRGTAFALCLGALAYLLFLKVLFPLAVRAEIAKASSAEEQPQVATSSSR